MQLFDTHTHFDVADFDIDRQHLAEQAKQVGVDALVLIGFVESRFDELINTHQQLHAWENVPCSYLAPGLHPFYIEQHQPEHLQRLEQVLKQHDCVAVGEIGLDTFLKQHKQPELFAKQQHYFSEQLVLAMQYQKPVLLHIRKAHAETIAILKTQKFKLGGIAHAFSGGVEEAKALVKLGFKIGVTGQITNPNAKKLHQVVQAIGSENLVIETDCPDMTPLCCQTSSEHRTRNTPVNLPYVLESLAQSLNQPELQLAAQLWQNSLTALRLKF
ncbi:TatD family hydrolase [Acinetobacter sp. TR11]|uniref:TatD family hydrolase n=1 Tax=Acinetobacter sp. TR11 TaxID=3003393 RepID=UPI0022ABFD0F|nr:TatD family hydrolase [Acinetobacter sp. TR11]WAU73122.1 TatD family hydrolase [Acinetobacter sp. TR11]